MKKIVFFALLGVIFFLRVWKVPEFFSFNFDEEYQASLAWSIVNDFHVIWIGVSASNLLYYLGPGFTYLNAFLFWISHGDPISLAYFSALLGLITTASVYFITKEVFSLKAALFASLIYGGSALLNYYDRRFWNPSSIPFITIWMFYSLFKAQKDSRWFILSVGLIAMSFHIHLGLMLLWPIFLYVIITNWRKIHWKTWLLMIGVYLLITSPLLVFDFVHNFDNIKAPLRFVFSSEKTDRTITPEAIKNHTSWFFSTLGRVWFMKWDTNIQEEHNLGTHGLITRGQPILSLFSAGILIWLLKRGFQEKNYRLLSSITCIYIVGFLLYPGYAAEYYLLGFLALFAIASGIFFANLSPVVSYLTIFVFVAANAGTMMTTQQEQYGLMTRKELVKKVINTVGERSYSLETYGKDTRKYHPYGGWRYLFKTYGKMPNQSFADEYFGWIYTEEISSEKPDLRVIISEHIPYQTTYQPLATFQKGVFYAYLFLNNQK